jgi:UDP-N-acetylglucosamine pyrophosphorylase
LSYFAEKQFPFLMECCRRTEADKKGGHLALRNADNQFILRESAQCSKSDEGFFQDVSRHRYFNTNNLWVRLDLLKELMDSKGGFVPLPTIFNSKTVDPQQDSSTPVFQLEVSSLYFIIMFILYSIKF